MEIDNRTAKGGINPASLRGCVDRDNHTMPAQSGKHLAKRFTALSARASRFAPGFMASSME